MSSLLKQCSWGQPSTYPPVQQQMRSEVQCIGTVLWGLKCWAKPPYTAHPKVATWVQQMVMRDATSAVGSDILGVPSITTTPNTIHLSAQPHHSMLILILLGLAGNDLFKQTWKVIHCTRTCDQASAFRQGCQMTNFTKFKMNSRNLGSTLLHKYGLVVLHQHVINFQQRHFGGICQNISTSSSSFLEVFCWAKSCKETKATTFLKTPRCNACKACWEFHGISTSSEKNTPEAWNSSFCGFHFGRVGNKLVNWEKSILGWAQRLWNGAKTPGRWEISHRAATKSACVSIKQTGSSWLKNVDQNLSQLQQYWSK